LPCAINSPCSSARRRGALAWVAPIACCGCYCRGHGRTGDGPSRSGPPTPSCAGTAAGPRSTGGGSHVRDEQAGLRWPPTSGLSSSRCTRPTRCGVHRASTLLFFTVPTATFRVLFVFVVLSHDRRRIVHVNVTAHPTAAWTAQQLREAWPWDTAPRFVIRDRDGIYGSEFLTAMQGMGIEQVLTSPRAPWQNPFVERVIGRHTARVPRPRHRMERTLAAPPPRAVPGLLPRLANPSLARQGRARPACGAADDVRHHRASPAPRWTAPSVRTSRRLFIALDAIDRTPPAGAGRRGVRVPNRSQSRRGQYQSVAVRGAASWRRLWHAIGCSFPADGVIGRDREAARRLAGRGYTIMTYGDSFSILTQ
jgi:hypothetical protein